MSDLTSAMADSGMSEKELQGACLEALSWQGWFVYHTYDSRRSQRGFPDVVAVKGSRLLFVEFKSEKGKVRPEQVEWLDALAYAHDDVYLVRPSLYDAFLQVMTGNVESGLQCHWNNQRGNDDAV